MSGLVARVRNSLPVAVSQARMQPLFWLGKRSTRVDSESQFAEKCKAIRDKKERFLTL